jgi:dTDP-4-dehydrorhamnose reductase
MRVVVIGAAGQLGSDLVRVFAPDVTAVSHDDLDVADAAAVRRLVADTAPAVVVNCAAFVNVDACESDAAQAAWRVNTLGAAHVAAAARDAACRVVYYSTNYVFDGEADQPYHEDQLPAPRGMYAITKLAGEHATLAYGGDAVVIRTAGLYGAASNRSKGGNFVERILARARSGAPLTVVDDQWLTPTFTADLADATRQVVASPACGVMHLTNSGGCSWHEFTLEILRVCGVQAPVAAAPTRPAVGVAQRPRNGVLASCRPDTPILRDWRDALAAYVTGAGLVDRV